MCSDNISLGQTFIVFSSAEQMGVWRKLSLNDPRRRETTTNGMFGVDGRETVKMTLLPL